MQLACLDPLSLQVFQFHRFKPQVNPGKIQKADWPSGIGIETQFKASKQTLKPKERDTNAWLWIILVWECKLEPLG